MFDLGLTFSKSTGGGTNSAMSKALMKFQSEQWRENTQWFNENGWKFMRQGLINGDYNPILAIGQSPLDGQMPNATAVDPQNSYSYDGASAMQANTARKMSDSQIALNKASAFKTAEEGLSQSNYRNMLDSQSGLNTMLAISENAQLPYKLRRYAADSAMLYSQAQLNRANAAYVPYNAESQRINANANKKSADTSLGGLALSALGLGAFGLSGLRHMLKRPIGFSTR